jgi:hypothetical protein
MIYFLRHPRMYAFSPTTLSAFLRSFWPVPVREMHPGPGLLPSEKDRHFEQNLPLALSPVAGGAGQPPLRQIIRSESRPS